MRTESGPSTASGAQNAEYASTTPESGLTALSGATRDGGDGLLTRRWILARVWTASVCFSPCVRRGFTVAGVVVSGLDGGGYETLRHPFTPMNIESVKLRRFPEKRVDKRVRTMYDD